MVIRVSAVITLLGIKMSNHHIVTCKQQNQSNILYQLCLS